MRSLSDEQVRELRELHATGLYSREKLGIRYGCSATTISLWLPEDSLYRQEKFRYKRKVSGLCLKCGKKLKGHSRCKNCTILLHGEECPCTKKLEEIGYWWK